MYKKGFPKHNQWAKAHPLINAEQSMIICKHKWKIMFLYTNGVPLHNIKRYLSFYKVLHVHSFTFFYTINQIYS